MNSLKSADVRGYIDWRRHAGVFPATINRELEVPSAAINHANRELEWTLPKPLPGRYLDEPEGRLRWLSRPEAAALVDAAAVQPAAVHPPDFLVRALHTGMRRPEILGLEWRRVDMHSGLVFLEVEHSKTKRRRSVPVNWTARSASPRRLRYRAKHCPSSPRVFCSEEGKRIKDVKRRFATACRRAGIMDFRIHDLRHTCTAWLVVEGVPLTESRDLLGHSTITMTERYAHLVPEKIRSAVIRPDQSHCGHTENPAKGKCRLRH